MLICPNCRSEIQESSSCENCCWSFTKKEGIKNYLKTNISIVLKSYIDNYERISEKDLEKSIQLTDYLVYLSEKILSYVKLANGSKICDVGGGQGHLAKACKSLNVKMTIVDIAFPYLKRLNKNFDCVLADAENLPFDDEFDTVFSTDIMEHVINMGSFLYCINKSLKYGGKFVVRVPYCENLMRYSPHLGCQYDFVHLRSFDKGLLKKCLVEAGFEVEKFHFEGYKYFACKPFLKKNKLIHLLYKAFCRVITFNSSNKHFIKNDSLFKSLFCRIFLKPIEIVCVAKKIKPIEKLL